MKKILLICMCIAVVTACSKNDDPSESNQPEPQGSFSLTSPDGTLYKEGQTVTVSSVNEAGTMRLDFWVKNNTKKEITLTMSQEIQSSNYDDIRNHATFCMDACYPAPLADGFISREQPVAAEATYKNTSGDVMNIDDIVPSFEAKVKYTITNSATKEKQTLIGLYKYTKK